jgi:hypothetical protein
MWYHYDLWVYEAVARSPPTSVVVLIVVWKANVVRIGPSVAWTTLSCMSQPPSDMLS